MKKYIYIFIIFISFGVTAQTKTNVFDDTAEMAEREEYTDAYSDVPEKEPEIAYGPGKAANAGGVATSQLEMAQNSSMQQWTFEEVDGKLFNIMRNIYTNASETAKEFGQPDNLVFGANIAGFRKVADAMIDQGVM